jgi:hypothetical protein
MPKRATQRPAKQCTNALTIYALLVVSVFHS